MHELPKRWNMSLLLCSGVVIEYCLRVNMSVAAQSMRDELNWSENQKGLVLSAFYWGYALGQIPASRFASIYGAKYLFGLSVLVPSIITLFVPLACRSSFGLALFSRAILGLFESASFPCLFHFFPIWIPINEKPLLISVIMSGMYIGEIIGFASSGYLTTTPKVEFGAGFTVGGWDSVFYIFGSCGILWYPVWLLCAHERPEDHPSISAEELAYINKGKNCDENLLSKATESLSASYPQPQSQSLSQTPSLHQPLTEDVDAEVSLLSNDFAYSSLTRRHSDDRLRHLSTSVVSVDGGVGEAEGTRANDDKILSEDIPWATIVSSPVVLTLFVQGWVYGWIGLTLLSEMPSYLTDQLGFDLSSAGLLSVLPYLTLFVSVIGSGNLFHWLQEEHGWSIRSVRLAAEFSAYGGVALGLIACGYSTSVPIAFFFMTMAQGVLGASNSGFLCSFLDIAPNHSPLLSSISNTLGAIAGIAGPILVGYLTTEYPGILGWRLVFFVTAAQCAFALLLWYFFQHSDIIPELNASNHENSEYAVVASKSDA